MPSLDEIKINRKLRNVRLKHFSHSFRNWRNSKRMTIAGDDVLFNDVFIGFNKRKAIRSTFGKRTDKILSGLSVGVYDGVGYCWIDNQHRRVRFMISRKYLCTGKKICIYLDAVHELVHIKQHLDGRDLWDERFSYFKRPTEIEAYTKAAKEGKNLGMSDLELRQYLNSPWESREDNRKFFALICKKIV